MTPWERLALMNYGHFTTVRVEHGRVRGLSRHLERLAADCRALFGAELDPELVRAEIRAAVAGAELPLTVRITVFDPDLPLDRPVAPAQPRLAVITRPGAGDDLAPLRLRSVEYVRDLPQVKHTGLFGPLYRRREAQAAGYDDAVFAAPDGLLAEGPTWNIAWLAGDALVLPAGPALAGVTLALLAGVHDGPVRTEAVTRADLGGFDAAFVTNAAFGLREVRSLDDTRWPASSPALARLRAAYLSIGTEPV